MNKTKKGDRRGFLLRLSEEQYSKLNKISGILSANRDRHISKQQVLEDLLDSAPIPDPLPQSSGKAKEESS